MNWRLPRKKQTLQRNFQGYTTHGHCDLIGLGVSAISQIGDLYCQNSSDLNEYQNTLAAAQLATSRGLVCNADDRLRRAVIQQLICNFSLEFAEIEQQFNIDFQGYFGALWPQLQGMANDGLIEPGSRADRRIAGRTPAGALGVHGVRRLPGTAEPPALLAGDLVFHQQRTDFHVLIRGQARLLHHFGQGQVGGDQTGVQRGDGAVERGNLDDLFFVGKALVGHDRFDQRIFLGDLFLQLADHLQQLLDVLRQAALFDVAVIATGTGGLFDRRHRTATL